MPLSSDAAPSKTLLIERIAKKCVLGIVAFGAALFLMASCILLFAPGRLGSESDVIMLYMSILMGLIPFFMVISAIVIQLVKEVMPSLNDSGSTEERLAARIVKIVGLSGFLIWFGFLFVASYYKARTGDDYSYEAAVIAVRSLYFLFAVFLFVILGMIYIAITKKREDQCSQPVDDNQD